MRVLEAGGRRLAYWDEGSGPPLVFVHGVGTSGEIWRGDLAELAADCRLVVYDRRGYGASGESPRDWRAHGDDAIALVEALDAAPAVIAGYSGGSIVALDLAQRRPDLAAAVVLLDPAFNLRRCITPGFLAAFGAAQLLRRLGRERRGAERWMRYVSRYPTGGCAFDRVSEERRARLLDNSGAIFADFASGGGEHVDESGLANLDVPVTIVDAALSPPFLRRSCRRLRRMMPRARTRTLEDSGHHLSVDARPQLLDVLREALGPDQTRPSAVATR